ncbi:MAG: S8 family peptidase [Parcubacteria group bacterium]|nr:S8 family peptidase [Parcubacteria group bacterium]
MYKKPQSRFFAVFGAFLLSFLLIGLSAHAKGSFDGRYFVASQNYLVKTLFGVQHEFKNGFTADLTSGEVWTLQRIFKVDVSEVPLYKVTALPVESGAVETAGLILPADKLTQQDKDVLKESARVPKPQQRTAKPENAVPWGIKKVYGDETIVSTNGGKGVNVAVLDTGANIKHLDLAGRIKDCKDFTRGATPRSACQDQQGHGTHVAGTIAADGGADSLGIWGVASEANLLVYKVCRNDGTCWADDVAAGLDYAVQSGAEVVSVSLGGNAESFILRDAIQEAYQKNVLVVAAAGNDGPLKGTIDWPAAYPEVVAVGAIAQDETIPDWSSRGVNDGDYIVEAREVEFGAPGVNVESTWYDGTYRYLSGTSMATPHVSGLAAKLWDGVATSTRVSLQSLARDILPLGDDIASGFGLSQMPVIK